MENIKIEELKKIIETQGMDGNWNYDNYMTGMYNGLVLAISIIEGTEPIFRDCTKNKKSKCESCGSEYIKNGKILICKKCQDSTCC